MAFCGNCGTKVEDGKKFCPECGTPMETTQQQAQPQQTQPQQVQPQQVQPQQAQPQQVLSGINNTPDTTANYDPADIEANKIMAVLAYFIFFLPLLAAKDSAYARFHANQGLLLLLAGFAVSIVGGIIPILGWFLIIPVGCVIVAVLGIIGLINAFKGRAKELPLIGKIKIIK